MMIALIKSVRDMNVYNVRIKDTDTGDIVENVYVDEISYDGGGILETFKYYENETIQQNHVADKLVIK